MPKSWKPEVIADASGIWYGNALRFRTREEAENNAQELSFRWMAVRDYRASESDDEPMHTWIDNKLGWIKSDPVIDLDAHRKTG